MLGWLVNNAVTVAVCAVLIAVCGAVIFGIVRDKKKGNSSCGCNCASCPMSGKCHK